MSNLKDLFCNIKWLIRQSFGKGLDIIIWI